MDGLVKITVIVPIYNAEKYLFECLDSFIMQSNKSFKVLLIDDGSTDKSGDIAKEYVNKYPDIFSYHYQPNRGLGGARNKGLSLINTPFTMFFDSDDFMADRAIENILNKINNVNDDVDIIFFNPIIFDMVTHSYKPWHDSQFMLDIFNGNDEIVVKDHPELMETEASVCRAIWRTSFLKDNNLKFLEKVHWEDVPPHFYLINKARKASFMSYEGAYYYRANNPLQITMDNGKSRLDMEIIFNEILPYFKSKDFSNAEKSYMISFLSNYMFWSINVIDDQYLEEFVNISHKFFKEITFRQYIRFFRKTNTCLRNKLMIYFLKSRIHYKNLTKRELIKKKMRLFKKLTRKKES